MPIVPRRRLPVVAPAVAAALGRPLETLLYLRGDPALVWDDAGEGEDDERRELATDEKDGGEEREAGKGVGVPMQELGLGAGESAVASVLRGVAYPGTDLARFLVVRPHVAESGLVEGEICATG